MRDITKIFKALSDTNRIRILKMLEIRPLCVCEITAVLREAGFIFDQKEYRWVNYHRNLASQCEYIKELLPLLKKWIPYDQVVIKDRDKVMHVDRDKLCRL